MAKFFNLSSLVLLSAALVACSAGNKANTTNKQRAPASKQKSAASAFANMPTIIESVKIEPIKWTPKVEAIGNLSALKGTTIAAETNGRITKVFYSSGQNLTKGQPIIEIFPDIVQAELKMAQAKLQLSELTYERDSKLNRNDFVSAEQLDQATANLKSDYANVEKLQAQLTQNIVRAPFSGKAGLKQISVGQYLKAGDTIVDLQQMDPLRISFDVPSGYLSLIKIGDPITFTVQTYPGHVFSGKIYAINSTIDQDTRMLPVRATVPNTKHLLLPGTFAEVTASFAKPQDVIAIPQTAVTYAEEGNYVYKVTSQHTAEKADVKLGPYIGKDSVIILKGVKAGDVIIIGGQMKLHPGAMVMTKAEAANYFMSQANGKK